MGDPEPIAELVKRLQEGDPQAAARLFTRYAQQLARLAEQHLSRKLAGRVDAEDIVQSVFRTFFRRSARGEFTIDGSAQIWQLLVKITLLKARAQGRRHTADRRDVGAEVAAETPAGLVQAMSREAGPAEAAALVDQIEVLLQSLPPLYCQVLELRLQGHSADEIAAHLNLSRRTVYRALSLLQQRLCRAAEEAPR